jgi:hypothetical protein
MGTRLTLDETKEAIHLRSFFGLVTFILAPMLLI